MKKLIFLLTILCSMFLLNGCGTSGTTSSETDAMIGEWCALNTGGFAKIKIEKKTMNISTQENHIKQQY